MAILKATSLTAILSLFTAGCAQSIHPLPEDLSRKATYNIVESLRCEARSGVLSSPIKSAAYIEHIIGYDFSFDITEINTLNKGELTFTHLVTGGNLSLGLSGGAEKTRKTERTFRLTETVKHLMESTELKCAGKVPSHVDFKYPIAGRVGIDEIVRTYAKLAELGAFAKLGTKEAANKVGKETTVFSDILTYTTKLSGGTSPTLTLTAVGPGLTLTKATFAGGAERTDIHKVTIAIAPIPATVGQVYLKLATSAGAAGPASLVIQELNRIRGREDDVRYLRTLRALE